MHRSSRLHRRTVLAKSGLTGTGGTGRDLADTSDGLSLSAMVCVRSRGKAVHVTWDARTPAKKSVLGEARGDGARSTQRIRSRGSSRPSAAGSRVASAWLHADGAVRRRLLFLLTPRRARVPVVLAVFAGRASVVRRDVAPCPRDGPCRRAARTSADLRERPRRGHRLRGGVRRDGRYHDAQIMSEASRFLWPRPHLLARARRSRTSGAAWSSGRSPPPQLWQSGSGGDRRYQRFAAASAGPEFMDALRGAAREVLAFPRRLGRELVRAPRESSKDVPGCVDAVRRSGLSRESRALGQLLVASRSGIGLLPGAIFAR